MVLLSWIKEREAWAARHFGDGSQFRIKVKPARPSNIAGVIAQMKWGVIGNLGRTKNGRMFIEAIKYREGKESGSAVRLVKMNKISDA